MMSQQFSNFFAGKNYPEKLPYISKVILLFQKIEGSDVPLFALYTQEFGSRCSPPNNRSVNIAYMDSVKYFRPEIKTAKGEAIRSFVYHHILTGYLDYCKKRGFTTSYIWSCPPLKKDNYILFRKPNEQKTPNHEKLKQWYQTMRKKSKELKVTVHFSSLWEPIFSLNAECKNKLTAAWLPYDGDCLCSIVEAAIKKVEEYSPEDLLKKLEGIPKRVLKAWGHPNPSAQACKDVLIKHQLHNAVATIKDHFFPVYLQHFCVSCHEAILSGTRWSCHDCKNYQCHRGDSHADSNGHKRKLLQVHLRSSVTLFCFLLQGHRG